jgi:hypothetical protein
MKKKRFFLLSKKKKKAISFVFFFSHLATVATSVVSLKTKQKRFGEFTI